MALSLAHFFTNGFSDWASVRALAHPAFRIRDEQPGDVAAREALLDRCFGEARFRKTCERLREGRAPAAGLSFVAVADGRVVGTIRFWHVEAGRVPGLMLGPVAVAPSHQSLGIGAALIRHGLARAQKLDHEAVILVGDAPYYERFGFSREATQRLTLAGPVETERFLGLDLVPGTLARAHGRVVGTGWFVSRSRPALAPPARLAALPAPLAA